MIIYEPEVYQPKLKATYTIYKDLIAKIAPWVDIYHIGSSSIKNALSKGDLDILVRAPKNKFLDTVEIIQSLDFKIKKNTHQDDQLCMLISKNLDEDIAIQVIESGSRYEMFLKFKDALNNNPALVMEYNTLKLNSVGLSEGKYRKRKSTFIKKVIEDND